MGNNQIMETIKIKLLTRKQFAEENDISEEAVRKAINSGNLSRVEAEWVGNDGTKYRGKFILPKKYVIVNRDDILKASKGISN